MDSLLSRSVLVLLVAGLCIWTLSLVRDTAATLLVRTVTAIQVAPPPGY